MTDTPQWREEIALRVARGEELYQLSTFELAALVLLWVMHRAPHAEDEIRRAWMREQEQARTRR